MDAVKTILTKITDLSVDGIIEAVYMVNTLFEKKVFSGMMITCEQKLDVTVYE